MVQYSDYFVFLGAVSIILGILGWVRAKSLPSLFAGGISGIALVASGIMIMVHEKQGQGKIGGYILALTLCVLLAGRFTPAFIKTKKLYPAGIMAIGSVIGIVFALLGWLKR